MIKTLSELQKEIYQNACKKGWHDKKFEKSIGENIALFHSEITEAYQFLRDDWSFQKIAIINEKPEGVCVEVSDVIIRILDFMASKEYDILDYFTDEVEFSDYDFDDLKSVLLDIHEFCSNALEEARVEHMVDVMLDLTLCVKFIIELFNHHETNLIDVIKTKMKYNTSRSKRHGGKVL